MSEIDWQAGDVAWINCEAPGLHMLFKSKDDWWKPGTISCYHLASNVTPEPVLVLRPDDDAGIDALVEAWMSTQGPFANSLEEMRAAVETLIAAKRAPKPPEEPLDPAVRVLDRFEQVWARIKGEWLAYGEESTPWEELHHEFGPLEILAPDGATDE